MIKQKRDLSIKGTTYADERKQRDWKYKSDSASPTVQIDLVILSIIIDALKNRVVGAYDVKGAYLNTLLNEFLCIKFEGE